MKKLLLLSLLFIRFLCDAQQFIPQLNWQKIFGGTNSDYAVSIIKTEDNGFLIGGTSGSGISGNKTVINQGEVDYWIIKLRANGSIEWQKNFGGSSSDNLRMICKSKDGGYFIGGVSDSPISGDKTVNSYGNYDYWVIKINKDGFIQWQKSLGGSDLDNLESICETTDGGCILGGHSFSNISGVKTENSKGEYDYWIVKLNSNGNIQWQKTFGGSKTDKLNSIKQTADRGYIVAGISYSGISGNKTDACRDTVIQTFGRGGDYWILKLDSIGNIKWQKTIGGNNTESECSITQMSDGGYVIGGSSASNISSQKTINSFGGFDYWLLKLDSNGIIQWQKVFGGNGGDVFTTLDKSQSDNVLIGGYSNSNKSGNKSENIISLGGSTDFWMLMINPLGSILWQKNIGGDKDDYLIDNIIVSDEECLIFGSSDSNISGDKTENNFIDTSANLRDWWLVKLNIKNNSDTVKGKIFRSQNSNCFQESNERGISGVILKTEPKSFYGITDTTGAFTILTDTGVYKVKQISPAILKPFLDGGLVCPIQGYHTVSFSQYGQDTTEINFANYEKQCPFLQVELTQSRMRRCFDNNATIKYCNIGNVDTSDVQVIVQLPEYISFVSASNPNYTISGKKITFNIGTLRANESGTISLVTHVDCVEGITGLTQCIKAQILPRNECVKRLQPDYELWDKSEIILDGICTGSTVRFVIKNSGQNMADSSTYRIYKNAVLALSTRFKLLGNDSLVINVSATGHTYRMEADQTLHYPLPSQPSITIENCGTGVTSRGFVNQQAQDFVAPDIEKICLEIRDSYDPNDKQISPSGVGASKLVPHKIPLDFLIRFQNTGTDTAYKVVITDTLNQNLDLSTLEFGAASHPYKFEFIGSGQAILKFTFDKINLVDSFTNEPKSHGFISFKIIPYDSIPNGTIVKNSADIYFDFNQPIKTNNTQVSIDDRLPTGATLNLVTSVKQNNIVYEAINVYPNPFTQTTNFEFVYNTKAALLIIYDVNGELIMQENIVGKTMFQLQRYNLPNGMYFYNVQNKDGEIIGRGKLVLQ